MNSYSECPICGNSPFKCNVDEETLDFLRKQAREGKAGQTLLLAKIVWENIPQLRHITESEFLEGLTRAMLSNFQQEIYKTFEPIKVIMEKLPIIIEQAPSELRKTISTEFNESRSILEKQFKTIIDFSPKPTEFMNSIQTTFEQMNQENKSRITEVEQNLTLRFKETLKNLGFPEPEQMHLLTELIPLTLPLLQELIKSQKIPAEKGRKGELELIQELNEYFPEDSFKHAGISGDTDIIIAPRFNGMNLDQRVIVESKKNSSWNRSFLQEVRKHMQLRGVSFALLAVETMPRGGNGFIFEQSTDGVVLVTSRDNFIIAYGALRSALITLRLFRRNLIDLRKLFSDQKIAEAIKNAYSYSEFIKRIKERAQRIDTNTQGIKEEAESLDLHLKQVIAELQKQINNAILQIDSSELDDTLNKPQPETLKP